MSYITNTFVSGGHDVPSSEKILSVCLKADGFTFSITSDRDELLAYGDITYAWAASVADSMRTIKAVFDEHGIIPFGFGRTELVVNTQQFSWVPDELYQPGNDKRYLDAICDVEPGKHIYCDHNKQIGAYIIFTADNNIVSAFQIALPGIVVRCQHSAFVSADVVKRSEGRPFMLVNLRHGMCDVVALRNEKLQLTNTYNCANFDEMLYRVLNVAKQLRFGRDDMALVLSGEIDRAHFAAMQHYVRNIDLYKGRPLKLTAPDMYRLHTYRQAACLA